MSTYLQDVKRKTPKLAAALAITGNQPDWALRNMVTALSMFPMMNTADENARLDAARTVLRLRQLA
jgi:hypothetical protein